MWGRKPEIRETELRRFLGDQMTLAEVQAMGHQRTAAVQRLLAKIQLLSQEEFDMAFQAFEAIVENCQHRKAGEKASGKPNTGKALEAAQQALTQTQKKSA